MNPVDHPMGGGEGRSSGGRKGSFSPWGWYTKVRLDPPPLATACSFNVLIIGRPQGLRTRNTKKSSSRIIVKRRNAEKLGLSATNKNGSW